MITRAEITRARDALSRFGWGLMPDGSAPYTVLHQLLCELEDSATSARYEKKHSGLDAAAALRDMANATFFGGGIEHQIAKCYDAIVAAINSTPDAAPNACGEGTCTPLPLDSLLTAIYAALQGADNCANHTRQTRAQTLLREALRDARNSVDTTRAQRKYEEARAIVSGGVP